MCLPVSFIISNLKPSDNYVYNLLHKNHSHETYMTWKFHAVYIRLAPTFSEWWIGPTIAAEAFPQGTPLRDNQLSTSPPKKKQLSPRAWQPRHNAVTYCSRFVSAHTTTSHRVVRLILNEKRDMKACNLVKSAGRPHSVIFEQFICSLVHSEETQQRCSLEGHWNVMSATCTVL